MTTKNVSAKKTAATTTTASATEFDPSGAPHQVADVDPNHAALDANPRAGTTDEQNRIDLNDPGLSEAEAVAKYLGNKPARSED